MDCWRPASYLEEEPIAPVWIVGGQLQGTRQDLLGVARVALLLVHPAHTGVEKEWSRNDFFGSGSDFSDYLESTSGTEPCFFPELFYDIFNEHFIPEITTRYQLL